MLKISKSNVELKFVLIGFLKQVGKKFLSKQFINNLNIAKNSDKITPILYESV